MKLIFVFRDSPWVWARRWSTRGGLKQEKLWIKWFKRDLLCASECWPECKRALKLKSLASPRCNLLRTVLKGTVRKSSSSRHRHETRGQTLNLRSNKIKSIHVAKPTKVFDKNVRYKVSLDAKKKQSKNRFRTKPAKAAASTTLAPEFWQLWREMVVGVC